MFGGPLLFLVIAIVGIRSLLGVGAPDAMTLLREGAVKVGMTEREVVRAVGEPRVVVEKETGGFTYRYHRGAWDVQRNVFREEDADVEFSPGGRVSSISFHETVPPLPESK